jgi:glycosyltransferase involved in cell wall biosynthesis
MMVKLLMVSTISRFLRDFLLPHAHYYHRMGWTVDALCSDSCAFPECAEAFDQLWEAPWSRNPLDPRNFLIAPRVIREVVKQHAYDLVHVHTPVASLVTRYTLGTSRVMHKPKIIYTAHGFHFHQYNSCINNYLFRTLEKSAGRWTDYLVVMNQEDREAALRYDIVTPERLVYMPGIGVDTSYYHPGAVTAEEAAAFRASLGIQPEETVFTVIAEFIPRKRHTDVLAAFALLQAPDVHLVLAGCGPLEESVRRLAHTLGMQQRVHFAGFMPDVRPLIAASNATVLASEQEGLPRCLLESLALRVPVISTDIRGSREVVTPECGMLVPLGDIPALAQAMEWMRTHPDRAKAMGQQGRLRVQPFALKHILEAQTALYAAALGDQQPIMLAA